MSQILTDLLTSLGGGVLITLGAVVLVLIENPKPVYGVAIVLTTLLGVWMSLFGRLQGWW